MLMPLVEGHGSDRARRARAGAVAQEIAYFIMRDDVTYEELGQSYFDQRNKERAIQRHMKQLEALAVYATVQHAA